MNSESVCGEVNFDCVKYRYALRPTVSVLEDFSVTLKAGDTLALVGPSGCGKSTILSLICRFYDIGSGILKFDGIPVDEIDVSSLRRYLGIVFQEPILFDGSVTDNIRYGALFKDVTQQEIEDAAMKANIHNFVCSLPEGYNTRVGEKGTQMSGGEKQRIAIARALLRDPKVLLLDEATSALDAESEKVVQLALDKAKEGRSTIVIAHRLSTIINSTLIAVIIHGRVAELGTHDGLLQMKGVYYNLWLASQGTTQVQTITT